MLRTTPKFKQYVKAQYEEWARVAIVLPNEERKAVKKLFNAVLSMPDSASSFANALPSDTVLMLMLIHLEARLDELERIAHTDANRAPQNQFQ